MREAELMGESAPWGAMGASLRQILRRGSGEILEREDAGLFLWDRISGAYMLAAPAEKGLVWLGRHEARGYRLLLLGSRTLCDAAEKRWGMTHRMDCVQARYPGRRPPAPVEGLTLRAAGEGDLPFLRANYHKVGEEELGALLRRQQLFIGLAGERPVGFVGEHLEGSIGLLFVLPAFRRQGYARGLEGAMIARALARGQEAFCHVEEDNPASLVLQERLGMLLSPDRVHWLWREG